MLTTKKGWGDDYIAYQEAVSAGYRQNDIRDSIKCYRYGAGETWGEWKVIFAVDPTKLVPSTANGWTQTTATGTLPSEGVYMVSFGDEGVDSMGASVLFFDGQNVAQATISALSMVSLTISYHPSASTKWRVANRDESLSPRYIYYKRIA